MVSDKIISGVERLDTSVPVVVIAPGYHGHDIARSLGRLGVSVYGVHTDHNSPSARSRYWRRNFFWDITEPTISPEASVDWLLNLGQKFDSRPILLPTDDYSCVFVADHSDALKESFLFPDQPPGLVRALSNKQNMYHLCKRHGIPTAETLFPQSRKDVIAFSEQVEYPVMLKGIDTLALRARTGVKMVLVHDAKTLLQLYDEMETPESPNIMIQEYLAGGSRLIWMFDGYFNDDSECVFGITGNKIRQYPPYRGVTSLGICLANEVVAEQTKAFMKAIGYRGILDIGYKYDDRTKKYKAFDANPRIGSTFRLFVDSNGLDVARTLYLDITGQPILAGTAREGRKWIVENFDLIASPRYWRDEKQGLLAWLASYRGVEEACWFASDDPRPFFSMGWASLRWAAKRAFGNEASLEPAAGSAKGSSEKAGALART